MCKAEPQTSGFVPLKKKASALALWENPKESGAIFGVGLLWFTLIGWMGYASVTVFCYLALFHLVTRLGYRNGCRVLADMNMIEKRPVPAAPETFVSEEDVLAALKSVTDAVNSTLHAGYALATCEDNGLVLKWCGLLYALALGSKLLGTTGLCFFAFASFFGLPKLYQLKQPEIDAIAAQASTKALALAAQLEAKGKSIYSELLGKMPQVPKASDLKAKAAAAAQGEKASNIKPKAL